MLRSMDRSSTPWPQAEYRFSSLVLEIVKSDPFQKRRGDEPRATMKIE